MADTPDVALRWVLCVLCFVLVGCPQETTFLDPNEEDGGDGGTQGIQRATLTVTARLNGQDSALARLGYGEGVLPGAEVTIERSGADASEQTGVTDASGQVKFEDLLEGIWSISFVRILTPQETAQFDSADADVNAFGGATAVTLKPPGMDVSVEAAAGRRGSLVISEISVPVARLPSGEDYVSGQWLEFYNSSDTTIYLDGKVIVRAITFVRDVELRLDCQSHAQWQLDHQPLGGGVPRYRREPSACAGRVRRGCDERRRPHGGPPRVAGSVGVGGCDELGAGGTGRR